MFRSKIINADNYNNTKIIRGVLYGIVIAGMVLIGHKKSRKGLLEIIGLPELVVAAGIIWLLALILLVIFYFYSRKTSMLGHLVLDENAICYTQNKSETVYNVSDVKDINITHNSFVGDDYKSQPMTNFRGNNYIEFVVAERAYKIEFEITSHYMNMQLQKTLDSWRTQNIAFSYREV